jgi:hypothetical protein
MLYAGRIEGQTRIRSVSIMSGQIPHETSKTISNIVIHMFLTTGTGYHREIAHPRVVVTESD